MKSYSHAMGASLCWALSANFTKLGIVNGLPPFAGTLLAITVAIPIFFGLLMLFGFHQDLKGADRNSLVYLTGGGFFSAIATLSYFNALSLGMVSIVVPVASLYPFFTLIMVFLFFRRERITRDVLLGSLAVVAGIFIVAM